MAHSLSKGSVDRPRAALHWAENIGDTVVKAVFMELKNEPPVSR